MTKDQRGFGVAGVLIVLAAVVVLALAAWFVWNTNKESDNKSSSTKQSQTTNSNDNKTSGEASNLETYKNEELGISFMHPASWKASVEKVPNSEDTYSIWISKVSESDVRNARGQGLTALARYNESLIVSGQYSTKKIDSFPVTVKQQDVLENITFNSKQFLLVKQTYNDAFTGTWLMNCNNGDFSQCSTWVPSSSNGSIDIRITSAGNGQASTVPVDTSSADYNDALKILKSFKF